MRSVKSTSLHRMLMIVAVFGLVLVMFSRPVVKAAEPQIGNTEAIQKGTVAEEMPTEAVEEAAERNPIERILVALIVIMLAAKLGSELLERVKQPAVLGELLFGVIIGNLALIGFHSLDYLKTDLMVEILAELGVILLLFEVGLESRVEEMMSVGLSSFLVALFGVIAPFFLGFWVSKMFLSEASVYVHIYIGAVLCATSVGITARVLQDLGRLRTKESRIILGAAVFDDIMGLVILAVVVGIIRAVDKGATLNAADVSLTILKAIMFFVAAIVIGKYLSPRLFKIASMLRTRGMLLITALLGCFILSFLADLVGLATIVGAFAAGLVLEPVHYRDFVERGEHKLEELLRPLTIFLVPIFFVRMGLRVELTAFAQLNILGFAAALTLMAIIGKQVCALGVVEKGLDRMSVGVGMIPRGEVGLIVASIGTTMYLAGQPVVNSHTFSAAVIMVMITTLITPPLLKYTLERGDRRRRATQETG